MDEGNIQQSIKPGNRIIFLLTLLFFILSFSVAIRFFPFQMDDAYITYRFAANFAEGKGLTFNPGGAPVEGFSSPFWLFLLTICHKIFGVNALPTCGVVLGFMSLMILMIASMAAAADREYAGQFKQRFFSIPSFFVFLLIALNPSILFYAVTGMEMILFLAVVIIFTASIRQNISTKIGMLAGFLAIWIRPEGIWLLIMMFFQLAGQKSFISNHKKNLVKLVISVLLGVGLLLLFRLPVFKSFLPNTYYAKQPSYSAGLSYVVNFFSSARVLLLLLLSFIGAAIGSPKHRGYFLGGISWVIAGILEGGDWMPHGRLLLPAVGLFIMSASGIFVKNPFTLTARFRSFPLKNIIWYPLIFLLVLPGLILNLIVNHRAIREAQISYSNTYELEKVLTQWVKKSGAQSIGTIDIGYTGFKTGIEIVDFGGLTDPIIGRSPGHLLKKEFDLNYILEERKPDLIVIRVSYPPIFSPEGRIKCKCATDVEFRIFNSKKFMSNYWFFMALLPSPKCQPYIGKLIFGRYDFHPGPGGIPPQRIITIPLRDEAGRIIE